MLRERIVEDSTELSIKYVISQNGAEAVGRESFREKSQTV